MIIKFLELYLKYRKGCVWLEKNKTDNLVDKFTERVILPLHDIWINLSTTQRQDLSAVMKVYEKFEGRDITWNAKRGNVANVVTK